MKAKNTNLEQIEEKKKTSKSAIEKRETNKLRILKAMSRPILKYGSKYVLFNAMLWGLRGLSCIFPGLGLITCVVEAAGVPIVVCSGKIMLSLTARAVGGRLVAGKETINVTDSHTDSNSPPCPPSVLQPTTLIGTSEPSLEFTGVMGDILNETLDSEILAPKESVEDLIKNSEDVKENVKKIDIEANQFYIMFGIV